MGNPKGTIIGGAHSGPQTERIKGNFSGTDTTGTSALANSSGIVLTGSNCVIGGTATGAGNTIAFNATDGVLVSSGAIEATGNSIRGNSIHDNGSGAADLGIDLSPNGIN